jgi:hypothetical protein
MCVQTWLTGLAAAQTFLAASLLKKHNTLNTLTNQAAQAAQINVECEYQLSGKALGSIVVRLPTSKQVIQNVVLTMLTNLVAKDPDHPCGLLLRDQFSARIGHAGVHLDDIEDAQLVDQLRARPLLVLGPYQLPDKLAHRGWLTFDEKLDVLEKLGTRASCQAYMDVLSQMDAQMRGISKSSFVCFAELVIRLVDMCITRIPTTGQPGQPGHPGTSNQPGQPGHPGQPSPVVLLLNRLCYMISTAKHCTRYDIGAFAVPIQTICRVLEIGCAQPDKDRMAIIYATTVWPFPKQSDKSGRIGPILDVALRHAELGYTDTDRFVEWVCHQVGQEFVKRIVWLVRAYQAIIRNCKRTPWILSAICKHRPNEKQAAQAAIDAGLIDTLRSISTCDSDGIVVWLAQNQPAMCYQQQLHVFVQYQRLATSHQVLCAMRDHMSAAECRQAMLHLAERLAEQLKKP